MKQRKKGSLSTKKNTGLKRHLITALMLVLLAGAAFLLLRPIIFTDTRAIVVDGKRFAFIRAKNMSTEEFNLLLAAKLKERYGKNVEINEKVELKPAHAAKKNISANTDVVIANLCDILSVKGECGAIVINGQNELILKSVAEAEKVLQDVLDRYTPEDEENVIGVEFIDDIKVEPYYADDDVILSETQAFEKMTQTKEETYDYFVRSGDSFNAIATKFGMKEDELMSLNPDINDNNKAMLQIGQKMTVRTQVPIYGIYTIHRETVIEVIEAPEEQIENLSQYKTYRRIISEGQNGEKISAYKVYYENGLEVKREPDPENDVIITDAIPRKVEVGVLDDPEKVNDSLGNFDYPIKDEAFFSSGFGKRDYGSGRHYGIDIACPAGTPVYASDGGTVVKAGWNSGGYGNWVVIDHHNGFKTIYGHNSVVLARAGQQVHKGEVVSLVGSTGDSTGNHLHFEIRLFNRPKDPLELLA